MTIQTINLGTYANDSTGDDLRSAFQKVNANFAALTTTINIASASNVGTGVGLFKQKNLTDLQFKSLTSAGGTVTISNTADTVDLDAITTLENDPSPTLGANLMLNGFIINGNNGAGDVQSSVYGLSVPILDSLLGLLISSNSFPVDLGTFLEPAGGSNTLPHGYAIDMGSFVSPQNNSIDFGTF